MNAFGNQVPVGAGCPDLLVTDRQQHEVQRERPGLAAEFMFQFGYHVAGPPIVVQARIQTGLLAGVMPVMGLSPPAADSPPQRRPESQAGEIWRADSQRRERAGRVERR